MEMQLSDDDEKLSEEDKKSQYELRLKEYHDNRVAYYDSWTKAWIENRMEKDKQLLTLSALAIGLLVGVFDQPDCPFEIGLWLLAGLSFLACVFTILFIFKRNSDYIETLTAKHLAEKEEEEVALAKKERKEALKLGNLTFIASVSFLCGVTSTIFLAILKQVL